MDARVVADILDQMVGSFYGSLEALGHDDAVDEQGKGV